MGRAFQVRHMIIITNCFTNLRCWSSQPELCQHDSYVCYWGRIIDPVIMPQDDRSIAISKVIITAMIISLYWPGGRRTRIIIWHDQWTSEELRAVSLETGKRGRGGGARLLIHILRSRRRISYKSKYKMNTKNLKIHWAITGAS